MRMKLLSEPLTCNTDGRKGLVVVGANTSWGDSSVLHDQHRPPFQQVDVLLYAGHLGLQALFPAGGGTCSASWLGAQGTDRLMQQWAHLCFLLSVSRAKGSFWYWVLTSAHLIFSRRSVSRRSCSGRALALSSCARWPC